VAGRTRSIEKSNYRIGNRIRDLAACSLLESYHRFRGICWLQFEFIRISHLGKRGYRCNNKMKENCSLNKPMGDSDSEKDGAKYLCGVDLTGSG
jgi:hypothetical protein